MYVDSEHVGIIIPSMISLIAVMIAVMLYMKSKSNKKLAESAMLVKRIVDSLNVGIIATILDREQKIIYANDGFYKLIGYSPEEFYTERDNSLSALIIKEDLPKVTDSLHSQLNSSSDIIIEFRIQRRDGKIVWMRANGMLSYDAHEFKAVSYILVDISEIREAQRQIEVSESHYSLIAEISDEYFFEYNFATDTILFSDKYAQDFNSRSVVHNYKKSIDKTKIVYHDDIPIVRQILNGVVQREKRSQFELRLIDREHHIKWYRGIYTTIFDDIGNPVKLIGKLVNIDQEKKEKDQLKMQAQTDPLTRLYNRGLFESRVTKYLQNKPRKLTGALFIVDIDGFKEINDRLGHDIGDMILREVAKTLKTIFRKKDTISRLGGDEFVVFMTDVTSRLIVEKKAAQLCRALNKTYSEETLNCTISASIGGAIADGESTFANLYRIADKALYEAKNSGKNCFVIS